MPVVVWRRQKESARNDTGIRIFLVGGNEPGGWKISFEKYFLSQLGVKGKG